MVQPMRIRLITTALLRATAIVLLATVGCERPSSGNDERDSPFLDHTALSPIHLNGEVLSSAPVIGLPSAVELSGAVIWIIDSASDPSLHAVKVDDGSLIVSLGRRGQGPGEFSRGAFSIGRLPSDSVWAFDIGLQRLTRFGANRRPDASPAVRRLTGSPTVQRVVRAGRNRFVGIASSDSARFALFSDSGVRERNVPGPLLGDSTIPIHERIRASNTFVRACGRPGSDGFVLAYGAAGRIEFYDAEARLDVVASVPFPSRADFGPGDGELVEYRRVRHWYSDCTSSDRMTFALFSGRHASAFPRGELSSGVWVHAFGQDGSLRVVYELDAPAIGIGVDPNGLALYSVSILDSRLRRYLLPEGVQTEIAR